MNSADEAGSDLEELGLAVLVSNPDYVTVSMYKETFPINNTVNFEVMCKFMLTLYILCFLPFPM